MCECVRACVRGKISLSYNRPIGQMFKVLVGVEDKSSFPKHRKRNGVALNQRIYYKINKTNNVVAGHVR